MRTFICNFLADGFSCCAPRGDSAPPGSNRPLFNSGINAAAGRASSRAFIIAQCVCFFRSPNNNVIFTLRRETTPHNLTHKWASGMRPGSGSFPIRCFFFRSSLSAIFSHLVGEIFPRSRPFFFFLCHVRAKKPVVSIVKFSRCSAAGVVSSGLWLSGDYYLKTWKSDRHKGKSALARLSTWGKSDASEVVQNEEETLKDVFFPFLLNACQASTDLPETWTCGLNACLFVFFSLLCFIQAFLVPLRVLKGGIFFFRQLCLSNRSHYSALTMCIILHTRFKEKHIRPPKVVWSLTRVLKYFRLWREIPVPA